MFKANPAQQYIPSKSVAIKPEVVSDVGQNDQIRINVPSFVGFLDPNQSYLKMKIKFNNARGQLVPDPDAGGSHAFFRNVLHRDGNNQTNLEFNEDYNANVALLNNYTETPSVVHKKELFSGVQRTLGDTNNEKTLYYAARANPAGAANGAAPDTSVRVANEPTVQFQLNCGLYKQGNILPVSAMNGLRIILDTEDILRACRYVDLDGEFSERLNASKRVRLSAQKAAGADRRDAAIASCEVDRLQTNNPFEVGDILYVQDIANGVAEEVLGVCAGFSNNGGTLRISYNPQRVDRTAGLTGTFAVASEVYYKVADRQVANNFFQSPTNDGADNVLSGNTVAPSYTLSDIEYIAQSVSPPAGYVEGLLRAAASEKGVSMDIMSYELHRANQSNTLGLTQIQIPTLMKRAKSLFTQPLPTSDASARGFAGRAFSGIPDSAKSYEWIHGTTHYPSRLVPLDRYSQVVSVGTEFRNEALHTSELQKAIVNVDEPVRNLHQIAKHFCVARGLSKYGQIQDLSEQTLSLRMDYVAGAVENKIFNNYIYGLRRITINRDGVSASM